MISRCRKSSDTSSQLDVSLLFAPIAQNDSCRTRRAASNFRLLIPHSLIKLEIVSSNCGQLTKWRVFMSNNRILRCATENHKKCIQIPNVPIHNTTVIFSSCMLTALFCPRWPLSSANYSVDTDQVIFGTAAVVSCHSGFIFPDETFNVSVKCITVEDPLLRAVWNRTMPVCQRKSGQFLGVAVWGMRAGNVDRQGRYSVAGNQARHKGQVAKRIACCSIRCIDS